MFPCPGLLLFLAFWLSRSKAALLLGPKNRVNELVCLLVAFDRGNGGGGGGCMHTQTRSHVCSSVSHTLTYCLPKAFVAWRRSSDRRHTKMRRGGASTLFEWNTHPMDSCTHVVRVLAQAGQMHRPGFFLLTVLSLPENKTEW